MINIKEIATFLTLSMCIAIHGASDDGWSVVRPRKKNIKTTHTASSKKTRSLAATSTDSLHTTKRIKSLKPTLTSDITTHIPSMPGSTRSNTVTRQKTTSGVIPLHMAALNDDATTIEQLITSGADICALDQNGATALHWAAGNGKTTAIQAILNHEKGIICIGIQDREGKTPLHRAAGIQSNAILIMLKKTPPKFIDLRDKDGSTALLWATSAGKTKAIKELIKKGADINAQDFVRGRTPLHWALRMRKGSTEKGGTHMPVKTSRAIIKHLVKYEANTTLKDIEGYSPLDWAHKLNLQPEIALLENESVTLRRSERVSRRR